MRLMRSGFFLKSAGRALLSGVLVAACFVASSVVAQEDDIPEPVDIELVTTDSINLAARYYEGTKGKESVPVIMLHAWGAEEGEIKEQYAMAEYLQSRLGCTVLVPDLRGHGNSLRSGTSSESLEGMADRWRGQELAAVLEDIEACKVYLLGKNNEGLVNIDLLTIVAREESCVFAAMWTLRDWSFQPIAGRKQGQDCKALILLDPEKGFNGLDGLPAYRDRFFTGEIGAGFPIFVAMRRKSGDAASLLRMWERGRKAIRDENKRNLDDIVYREENNQLIVRRRGSEDKLLAAYIADFLQAQVIDRMHDFRWQDRSSK